jgi:hypothetical protein
MENGGGMILTGENQRKTCPSTTLSTTNPIWIDLGANLGLHGERQATNGLSHGTAVHVGYFKHKVDLFHKYYNWIELP